MLWAIILLLPWRPWLTHEVLDADTQIELALLEGSREILSNEDMGRGWVHAMHSLKFLERLITIGPAI